MATKLFLRNTTNNGITDTGDGTVYDLSTTAGSSLDTGIVNTSASGTNIQLTKTAGGSSIAWITGRVPSGGFTLTTSDISTWWIESNMNANCGARLRVYKYTPGTPTITELGASPFDDGAEFGTSDTEMTWLANMTDTAFSENDRILIRLFITNVGTMAGGHTCTMSFNAADAATGDSFYNINETVAFKPEIVSVTDGPVGNIPILSTYAVGQEIVVSGVGFQPSAVIFFGGGSTTAPDTNSGAIDARGLFGVATSSSSRGCIASYDQDNVATTVTNSGRREDACIATLTSADAWDGLVDFVSFSSDGFTIVVDDALALTTYVSYMALNSSYVNNASVGTFQEPGATGNQDITSAGFEPNAVFIFATAGTGAAPEIHVNAQFMVGAAAGASINNAVSSIYSGDGAVANHTAHYTKSGECIAILAATPTAVASRASVTAWLSNGFTLNWAESGSATRDYGYLALNVDNAFLGNFTTQTDTTAFAETGVGFRPSAVFCANTSNVEDTSDTSAIFTPFNMGAFTSSTDVAAEHFGGTNTLSTLRFVRNDDDALFFNATTNNIYTNVNSVDSDGFTLQMATADSTNKFVWYMALGATVSADRIRDTILNGGIVAFRR